MDNLLKTVNNIPQNDQDIVIINILNNNDELFNTYDIIQDECHDKLKKTMRLVQSKYEEEKIRIYRLRDLYLLIDMKGNKKYISQKNKKSYTENGILVNIYQEDTVDKGVMPTLKNYHSVVYQKKRNIEYNGITLSFIEERNDKSTINYIQMRLIKSNKEMCDDIYRILTNLLHE